MNITRQPAWRPLKELIAETEPDDPFEKYVWIVEPDKHRALVYYDRAGNVYFGGNKLDGDYSNYPAMRVYPPPPPTSPTPDGGTTNEHRSGEEIAYVAFYFDETDCPVTADEIRALSPAKGDVG